MLFVLRRCCCSSDTTFFSSDRYYSFLYFFLSCTPYQLIACWRYFREYFPPLSTSSWAISTILPSGFLHFFILRENVASKGITTNERTNERTIIRRSGFPLYIVVVTFAFRQKRVHRSVCLAGYLCTLSSAVEVIAGELKNMCTIYRVFILFSSPCLGKDRTEIKIFWPREKLFS